MSAGRERQITVSELTDVRSIRVRDGFDWAEIHFRPFDYAVERGHPEARRYQGLSVSAHSSFGNFGYVWGNLGDRDWRTAVAGMDFGYAMNKLAANHGRVFDPDGTRNAIRTRALEYRREGCIEKHEAREFWEETSCIPDTEGEFTLWWSDQTAIVDALYGGDWSDLDWRHCACPQAWGFWEFWRAAVTQLAEEAARVA